MSSMSSQRRSRSESEKSRDDDNDDIEEEKERALSAELRSLRAIVDNPITLYCLRMFMAKNLTINNLLFVLEADEWAVETRRKFNSLCHKYCNERSPAQINLTAKQFARITRVQKGDTALS